MSICVLKVTVVLNIKYLLKCNLYEARYKDIHVYYLLKIIILIILEADVSDSLRFPHHLNLQMCDYNFITYIAVL